MPVFDTFTKRKRHAARAGQPVMKSGLPPVRHNFGGHGQGATVKVVERHLSAYSLHLMAANIVLLIQAHQALKTK
jgi:Domain of unknown function (DUF7014)